MRLFSRLLLLALCMGVLSGGPAIAAENEQSFLSNLAAKFSTPAKSPEEVCPVTPAAPAAAAAPTSNALNATTMKDLMAKTQELRVSFKNLPSGNYRERCFACLTTPNEDMVRELSCVCPVSDTAFSRISIPINKCKPDEVISFCGSMLVCGKCQLNEALAKDMPKPGATQVIAPTQDVLQQMFPNKPKQ